jgi:hypothetical protein
MTRVLAAVALAVALLGALPRAASAVPVDLELVLLMDVSGSTDASEFALQRDGWAAALVNPTVVQAIQNGPNHAIAVSVVFFQGPASINGGSADVIQQVVPWTLVTDSSSAQVVSNALAAQDARLQFSFNGQDFLSGDPNDPNHGSGPTGVTRALNFSTALLQASNGFEGTRRVIDLSGDGYENVDHNPAGCNDPSLCTVGNVINPPNAVIVNPALYFASTDAARDAAVAAGITINGLPILTDIPSLATFFYGPWATGGTGSFVKPANGFADIQSAATQKLISEVVPEPAALALLACAAAALARRRARLP